MTTKPEYCPDCDFVYAIFGDPDGCNDHRKPRLKVYLAGGMRGEDWRADFRRLTKFYLLDPHDCSSKDPAVYTEYDLRCVRAADVVVAFLEPDNPSGIGLALEVGYAKALGKRVVFIDGRPEDKRFDIMRHASDAVVTTVWDAICSVPQQHPPPDRNRGKE